MARLGGARAAVRGAADAVELAGSYRAVSAPVLGRVKALIGLPHEPIDAHVLGTTSERGDT